MSEIDYWTARKKKRISFWSFSQIRNLWVFAFDKAKKIEEEEKKRGDETIVARYGWSPGKIETNFVI